MNTNFGKEHMSPQQSASSHQNDAERKLRIAVVGSGIAGLTCARGLSQQHEVTLFEKESRLGGHTHTVWVDSDEESCTRKKDGIDTGFIVFNDWTYPHFIALMDTIGVDSQESSMGFSVKCDETGLEYQGKNLDTLFAQRRNFLNLKHIRMLLEILRFNKQSLNFIQRHPETEIPLGEFLNLEGYSDRFRSHYILPMGAAIWSSSYQQMMQFPLKFFVSFFKNHGMLSVNDRPTWRVIQGGSSQYLSHILKDRNVKALTDTHIHSIRRNKDGVEVLFSINQKEKQILVFDQIVLACHSDQALSLLHDASPVEKQILEAIPYQPNETVLHTDTSVLPKNKKAWAAWNYLIPENQLTESANKRVSVTYHMNILQGLSYKTPYLVSLNMTDRIDPRKILHKQIYHHPVFQLESPGAQRRWKEISQLRLRTHFAGAYWRNGFHEDGVWSALKVLDTFGIVLDDLPQHKLQKTTE